MADDEVKYSITPQGEAYCEFMIAHPNAEPAEYFSGGWDARQAEIDALKNSMEGTKSAVYWQVKAESAERERDNALMRLSSSRYEAGEWRRQRDVAQKALPTEATVTGVIQDICDLEPDPGDCAETNPEKGICINFDTLEIILRRHILGEE